MYIIYVYYICTLYMYINTAKIANQSKIFVK